LNGQGNKIPGSWRNHDDYRKVSLLGFAPNAFKIFARGQKPVKADWSKLAPTKAVNTSQYGLKSRDKRRLIKMKLPAKASTRRSTDIVATSFTLPKLMIRAILSGSKIRFLLTTYYLLNGTGAWYNDA
jgi:hypothetical protein